LSRRTLLHNVSYLTERIITDYENLLFITNQEDMGRKIKGSFKICRNKLWTNPWRLEEHFLN